MFIGVAMVAPRVVKPIASVVDPFATWAVFALSVIVYPITLLVWLVARPFRRSPGFPGVRPDRTANNLAKRNARRNPSRTAMAAAALMIGLALVTFFFPASTPRASFRLRSHEIHVLCRYLLRHIG